MSRIFVFLAGVVSSVLVVGGVAAWFLFLSPEAEKSTPPPIQAPVSGQTVPTLPPVTPNSTATGAAARPSSDAPVTNFPTQADAAAALAGGTTGQLFLDGRISLPPQLRKVLEKYPKAALSIRFLANSSTPNGQGSLVDQNAIQAVNFPQTYRLEVNKLWIPTLQKFDSFTMFARAVICLERQENKPCNAGQFPNIEGSLRFLARVPRDSKGSMQISVPNLILNRHQQKAEAATCAAANNTISGVLQQSAAFQKSGIRRVLVIGSPYHEKRPPVPFAGPPGGVAGVRVTAADIASMANHGITYTSVSLAGGDSKFSLAIPAKFSNELYRLFYFPCAEGEPENVCLLNAFPLSMIFVPGEGKAPAVPIVSKGFEAARCGMKDHVFYLHNWDLKAPRATEETMHLADPPELLEGAVI